MRKTFGFGWCINDTPRVAKGDGEQSNAVALFRRRRHSWRRERACLRISILISFLYASESSDDLLLACSSCQNVIFFLSLSLSPSLLLLLFSPSLRPFLDSNFLILLSFSFPSCSGHGVFFAILIFFSIFCFFLTPLSRANFIMELISSQLFISPMEQVVPR